MMYVLLKKRRVLLILTLASCLGLVNLYYALCCEYVNPQRWVYQEKSTIRYVGSDHLWTTTAPAKQETKNNTKSPPISKIEHINKTTISSVSKTENTNKPKGPSVSKIKKVKKTKSHPVTRAKNISLFQAQYGSKFTTRELMAAVSKLNATLTRSWSYNETELDKYRHYLVSGLWGGGKRYPFYLTKANIEAGNTLPFYITGRPQNVSQLLWSSLPEKPILRSDRRFRTCSVVGSSGILLGSNCGREIDQADFVIRFNLAAVHGFEADVGRKTNLTTLNPTYVRKRFGSLKSQENIAAFKAKLDQFRGALLMLPAFGVRGFQAISLKVAKTVAEGDVVTPVYGDPRHFLAVKSLWKPILNSNKLPTTGLYMLTAAFEWCEHIRLFGAWPFKESPAHENVSYHYHDNVTQSSKHSFHTEFWYMYKMHSLGIIKLQYSNCL